MKGTPSHRISALRRVVLRYYRRHGRDLPWRSTRDPYRIFVSEVMLQQTQAQRVIPKYRAFLRRFPTLDSLAQAKLADVLRAWLGLGYNGRAVRLWRCARLVVAHFGGELPGDEATLRTLPGVGRYTAAAVASFAFGVRSAPVDVNVRRVLARTLTGSDQISSAALTHVAQAALPARAAGEWTQALMDIGAMYCRPAPKCAACPAARMCRYRPRNQRARIAPARRQPVFKGSARFYRGRILRALARVSRLSVLQLGLQVKEGFGISDRPWLHAILQTLQRDGLVRLNRGERVSLP